MTPKFWAPRGRPNSSPQLGLCHPQGVLSKPEGMLRMVDGTTERLAAGVGEGEPDRIGDAA